MGQLKCAYDPAQEQTKYSNESLELFRKIPGLQNKVEAAADKLEDFKNLVRTVANKLEISCSSITIAPPKSIGTIVTKAERKFNGDISRVLDDNRATIELKKEGDVEKVLRLLDKAMKRELPCLNGIEVKSLKNTFGNAAYKGFEVVKANFILDDVPTEIMFRYPCDEKALKQSHEHYEKQRAIAGTMANLFHTKTNNLSSDQEKASLYATLGKALKRHTRRRNTANDKAFKNG